MKTYSILILLFITVILVNISCGGEDKVDQSKEKQEETRVEPKQKKQDEGSAAKRVVVGDDGITYVMDETFKIKTVENPPLTPEIFREVYDNADYTEIIFENMPFTLSQENKQGILILMSYMDNKPPVNIDFSCPLFGQQLYQVRGEVVLEADIFMGPNCNYYVFSKGDEKFYNAMTPKGVEFYNNLVKKAMEGR